MRQILEQTEDGEKRTLIFKKPEDREDFFARARKSSKDRHIESIEKLRRAYMESVAQIDEAFRKELGELRELEQTALLESDLEKTP